MAIPEQPMASSPNPAQTVDPTVYLHPQTLARLGTLELRAKMIVEGVMSGMHRSPYHGFSVEFAQHRPYVPGDDLRHLDWKVYGRSDKLHLKQYEQETNLDLVLLVDSSGSMDFGSRSYASASSTGQKSSHDGRNTWIKFDHATATAAAISFMALRQSDRVGLGMFADSLVDAVDRGSSQGQWRRIVSTLAAHPVDRPTDFGRVIDQTLAKLNNRCIIAIISDFFADPNQIRTALARIKHRRHDAILFQVLDEQEVNFSLDSAAPFEGFEGEPRVRIDPRAVRQGYLEAFKQHSAELDRAVRGFGFDIHRVMTNDWLGPPLAAFMARRNAIMKTRKSG
ncbi:MAG: DUF58 domain-containing protein [Phycisphaerales bacterium JB050]